MRACARRRGRDFVKKLQEAKTVQDQVQNETGKGQEDRRLIRARQRAIGRELRRFYDAVAEEPVPDEFLDLLKQIEMNADKDGKGGDGP